VFSYRLKSAIVGVERSAAGMHITNIPSGWVLTLPDTDKETGMIEIVFEARNVSVFLEDIRERGERVDRAGRA
jgi:hypothetical protein